MKRAILNIIFIFFFLTGNLFSSQITYEEILDNPSDLQLNLNYAKQQQNSGNLKLTIATLERLSMLYPENLDIKLYLLSILIEMDSSVKVDLMVRTLMNDPNTTGETKKVIAGLLSNTKKEKKEKQKSKWFAYLDLKYSHTEEDNISGVTKSKKNLQENNLLPYPQIDNRLVVEYDKTYTKAAALTLGKNINDTSSMFLNFGLDSNTINKKIKGDSDVVSSSVSYFKILGNHYLSPYFYWNRPNYRKQEDSNSKGVGINNTLIINEKSNINYNLGFANTSYDNNLTFSTANESNSDVYSSFLRYNYNVTNKIQLGAKIILNRTETLKEFDSFDSNGFSILYSQILPFGTLKFKNTYLQNNYDDKETFISTSITRNDESLVTSISLEGQINQILPVLKTLNKDNSIFYSFNLKQSDVSSNIANHDILRNFITFGLTKRINLNVQ